MAHLPEEGDTMSENNDYRKEKARLRRFKLIAKALSERVVCAGWQDTYRREEADRFLRYLERRARGSGYHGKTENELYDFLYVHGQSIDYLFSGDPTTMFSGLACGSSIADVIRERRRGVSDKWSKLEKHESACDKRRLQNARRFMGPARKRAKAASTIGRGTKATA